VGEREGGREAGRRHHGSVCVLMFLKRGKLEGKAGERRMAIPLNGWEVCLLFSSRPKECVGEKRV